MVSVSHLAEEFAVSKRTIYRDLQALEQAGVPLTANGRQRLWDYGRLHHPPTHVYEEEANAIISGEKFIAKTKDESLILAFSKATEKN